MMTIEICASNISSAIAAHQGGAPRIELCAGLALGGLSPSAAAIEVAVRLAGLETCVMLRPREGDFCYSAIEVDVILQDIAFCKSVGAHGIVSGAQRADGTIDEEVTGRMMDACGELPFVYHRAFDRVPDQFEALETLIRLGVRRVLTSGAQPTAWEGREQLKRLIQQANGRITVMPGAGVRTHNIIALQQATGATEIHLSSGGYMVGSSGGNPTVNIQGDAGIPAANWYETNADTVKEVMSLFS